MVLGLVSGWGSARQWDRPVRSHGEGMGHRVLDRDANARRTRGDCVHGGLFARWDSSVDWRNRSHLENLGPSDGRADANLVWAHRHRFVRGLVAGWNPTSQWLSGWDGQDLGRANRRAAGQLKRSGR